MPLETIKRRYLPYGNVSLIFMFSFNISVILIDDGERGKKVVVVC